MRTSPFVNRVLIFATVMLWAAPVAAQTPAFDAAQDELKKAVERLFADAKAALANLPQKARKAKALRSLLNHREGSCVFVDHPQIPIDNNAGERALRGPVIGRRLSFGSNSEDGAKFTEDVVQVDVRENRIWEPYDSGNLIRCGRCFSRDWARIRFP